MENRILTITNPDDYLRINGIDPGMLDAEARASLSLQLAQSPCEISADDPTAKFLEGAGGIALVETEIQRDVEMKIQ